MVLVICEKPAQARDIARNLKAAQRKDGHLEGNGHQVTWCVGHLLELAPSEYYKPNIRPWRIEKLPVVPGKWEMLISPRTKKQFNIVKGLLKKTNHVLIASDPDREGECIVREILEKCHYQGKTERLWLNALDDASIQKALKNIRPGSGTENLYYAGQARAKSDYLIGMNLTMAVSALYGVNSVLSVGRVQTPTLNIVVQRDQQIENFRPHNYFVLKGLFSTKEKESQSFWATWQAPENCLNENGFCSKQAIVENTAAKVEGEPGNIKSFAQANKTQKAPLCFSLSSLQKKASSLFGFSAKRTLELAQSLYETHKATTYPRTDCGYLPEEQFGEAEKVFGVLKNVLPELKPLIDLCNLNFKSPVWNSKKVTAHHGIIPTFNGKVDLHKMPMEEQSIYALICRQYLAQFLGDYEFLQCKIEIVCAGEIFTAIGNTPTKTGWKRALKKNDDKKEQLETLPQLKEGQTVHNEEAQAESKQTQPPARFTEGTLIGAMKNVGKFVEDSALKKTLKDNSGIGTEATRANILEVLFKRGYLERKGKHVISTEKGRALTALVPSIIKDPILTAEWEQQLEQIAEGKGNCETFIAAQANLLNEMLQQLQAEGKHKKNHALQLQSETQNGKVYLCPTCESPLRCLKSKKGKFFWGCSAYPTCGFTTWEKSGKPSL